MSEGVVFLHSSEQMPEVQKHSVKLLLGPSVYLGKDTPWSEYEKLYRQVYITEGLRVLRPEDGVFLLLQTDAYEHGQVVPKNAMVPLMLLEAGYKLLDERVWMRKKADFFQPPFSMVWVFVPPGSKLSRKAFEHSPGYFRGVWDYPQAKGANNAYPEELCGLMVETFTARGDLLVDPFAGSARLIGVAARNGRRAIGYEIDEALIPIMSANLNGIGQVLRPGEAPSSISPAKAADQQEPEEDENGIGSPASMASPILQLGPGSTWPTPTWITGDSTTIPELLDVEQQYDLIFSCPPYADLERYSDDPNDLSTMEYEDFMVTYKDIIMKAVGRLRNDRFACFVVGDVRNPKGIYRNFVAHTIEAFQEAGAMLYNEAVFITQVGSLAVRVGRQFEAARKLGKTHQNVLVFIKGDAKKATAACGPVEFGDIAAAVADEGEGDLDTSGYIDDPKVIAAIPTGGAWHPGNLPDIEEPDEEE